MKRQPHPLQLPAATIRFTPGSVGRADARAEPLALVAALARRAAWRGWAEAAAIAHPNGKQEDTLDDGDE